MANWQIAASIYGAIGLGYMYLEHKTFSYDFSEASQLDMFLVAAQQSVHFLRVAALWPTYLIEDVLIYVTNRRDMGERDE